VKEKEIVIEGACLGWRATRSPEALSVDGLVTEAPRWIHERRVAKKGQGVGHVCDAVHGVTGRRVSRCCHGLLDRSEAVESTKAHELAKAVRQAAGGILAAAVCKLG
jgi:hypothetical protein